MPCLELKTNVQLKNPRAFIAEFSKLAAKVLQRPEQFISVTYQYREYLAFNGTLDPAFILDIKTLDNLSPELNEQYSKTFFEFFKEHLGVEGKRGYITFADLGRINVGYNSTTIATILAN
ncbi:Tautomerase/MIF [Rhodofomes roseus]|uniref:L-dopachrome isomerase n=1 Tax=Rhodofomes roseus TaxID=34475 RepID=A0ABQ8KTY3_9APHY|nr:Tautomerase/MIF [Rhodofomes roseus]KAH9842540.1 Tautomerase/MIF [Rhodofomes roseus]